MADSYTPEQIKTMVTNVSKSHNLDPKLMLAILATENSSFATMPNQPVAGGGQGLYQIIPETWKSLTGTKRNGLSIDTPISSVDGQIQGACALMSDALVRYRSTKFQLNAAIIDYNMGPTGGEAYIQAKNQGAGDTAASIAAIIAIQPKKGDPQYLEKVLGNMGKPVSNPQPVDVVSIQEVPFNLVTTPAVDTSALASSELVISDGLDSLAWFDDPNTLLGNPGLLKLTPVSFSINLKEFDNTKPLPTKMGGTDPIIIRLNCSLSETSISMKHIINKTNSRTGFHMTFWGMEPDTITGSGSTGVFLNRTGVTDLMSLAGGLEENGALDDLELAYDDNAPVLARILNAKDPLRVAAQDAFVELLATFRNNGIIRYRDENYDANTTQTQDRTQIQNAVWSERYGGSNYTRLARLNDVMVKGNVVMKFKNSIYHGYFKSLSWVMDAEHPFHWKFDFTFQVQKTISYAFYPKINPGVFDGEGF